MTDWRKALLGTLGYKTTPQNLKFLDTWQRWEGGHTNNSARFNWLNTTHGDGPAINSVGVKRFASFQQGIQSTAQTLMNGRYDDILDGLASGDPYTRRPTAGLQVWVSGREDGNPGYAAKILGGDVAAPPLKQRQAAAVKRVRVKVGAAKTTSPNAQWDSAMKLIFADDPEMVQLMAGMDDVTARATKWVSPGGSVKPLPEEEGGPAGANRLTRVAAQQLGKPYVFGSGPDTASFDCSDLIQWAYKQIGVSLPRTTFEQINVGRSVKGKALQPGDLVFPSNHHVVMYVGDGKVIAAPHTGTVVQYQPLSRFGSLLDVRRVL